MHAYPRPLRLFAKVEAGNEPSGPWAPEVLFVFRAARKSGMVKKYDLPVWSVAVPSNVKKSIRSRPRAQLLSPGCRGAVLSPGSSVPGRRFLMSRDGRSQGLRSVLRDELGRESTLPEPVGSFPHNSRRIRQDRSIPADFPQTQVMSLLLLCGSICKMLA